MAYDEILVAAVAKVLDELNTAYEPKRLMGGLCFCVNDKMCIGVGKDKRTGNGYLIARVGHAVQQQAIEDENCHEFKPAGRVLKDFVKVDIDLNPDIDQLVKWVKLSLEFNPLAKSSKKSSRSEK